MESLSEQAQCTAFTSSRGSCARDTLSSLSAKSRADTCATSSASSQSICSSCCRRPSGRLSQNCCTCCRSRGGGTAGASVACTAAAALTQKVFTTQNSDSVSSIQAALENVCSSVLILRSAAGACGYAPLAQAWGLFPFPSPCFCSSWEACCELFSHVATGVPALRSAGHALQQQRTLLPCSPDMPAVRKIMFRWPGQPVNERHA